MSTANNFNKLDLIKQDLFSSWRFEEIISDIGHAFHAGYFSDPTTLESEKVLGLKFNIFIRQYKDAWIKRDILNKQILKDISFYGKNISNQKLYQYLLKLNRSLSNLL